MEEDKRKKLQQIQCNVLLQYFITCVNLLDFMCICNVTITSIESL